MGCTQPMLRLVALSLLVLAATQAAATDNSATAAEQIHPCQAQTPPCSVGRPLPRSYLNRQTSNPKMAYALLRMARKRIEMVESKQDMEKALELIKEARAYVLPHQVETLREKEEWFRRNGPGTDTWAEYERYRREKTEYQRYRRDKSRYYVPLPLSRELLTGAVNPCDSAYASCPPRLERLYDWLSEARRRDDQSGLETHQRSLRYYYRYEEDYRPDLGNPCDSTHASCPSELDSIYRGLSDARRRDDQLLLEIYQRDLRNYYDNYRP